MPDTSRGRRRLAVLLLAGALALTGCRGMVAEVAQGNGRPQMDAELEARDEAERSGWRDFTILQTRRAPGSSYVFYAYRSEDELGDGGAMIPVECYGFTVRDAAGPDGATGGGGGMCIGAGEAVPPNDWSWSSDRPNVLLGSLPVGAIAADVVYDDGEVQRVDVLNAGPSWGRVFVNAVLTRAAADVVELRPVLDAEG